MGGSILPRHPPHIPSQAALRRQTGCGDNGQFYTLPDTFVSQGSQPLHGTVLGQWGGWGAGRPGPVDSCSPPRGCGGGGMWRQQTKVLHLFQTPHPTELPLSRSDRPQNAQHKGAAPHPYAPPTGGCSTSGPRLDRCLGLCRNLNTWCSFTWSQPSP